MSVYSTVKGMVHLKNGLFQTISFIHYTQYVNSFLPVIQTSYSERNLATDKDNDSGLNIPHCYS